MALDFEQVIGGIEDGIIAALEAPMIAAGVKEVGTYTGELDAENLKEELASFAEEFPKVMVSYTDGVDVRDTRVPNLPGRAIPYRHDCWFAVIVASNDPRGERARRRGFEGKPGTYKMLAMVRELVSGLTIKTTEVVDGEEKEVMLTFEPLTAESNEHLIRIPNVTAQAVMFKTFFRWRSPERAVDDSITVTEVIVDVEGTWKKPTSDGNELPGVHLLAGQRT